MGDPAADASPKPPRKPLGRLRRLATSDHARPIGRASSFHAPHRLTGNVVGRLSASSALCATTTITGMLTSTVVMWQGRHADPADGDARRDHLHDDLGRDIRPAPFLGVGADLAQGAVTREP